MKYSVQINRFDGGLNTKATQLAMQPDESPDCQNIIFDDYGAVGTGNGYTSFVSAAIQTAAIDGIYSYVKDSGTKEMLVGCAGTMWRMSGNTAVTIGSGQSVFTTGVTMRFITHQDQAFMSNGYQSYKWNGTELTLWGVTVPSAATVAINSAGTLTGGYKYVILGVNSNVVNGSYGSATAEITLATQRAYLTEIPVFPTSAGVNNKIIARNTALASGVYYVVTQIANATTVYEDNNSDSKLLTLAPSDNGRPGNFTTFCEHLGYIFGANENGSYPSFLFYSVINEPEIFRASDYIRIGESDGFVITGISPFAGSLVVHKSDRKGNGALYLISTPNATPANWVINKLNIPQGTDSPDAIVKFFNYLLFVNKNGITDIDERELGLIKSDSLSYKIDTDVLSFSLTNLSKAVGTFYKNKAWLSIPYGTSQTTNNRVYQYDPIRGRNIDSREVGSWTRFTDMAFANFTIHSGTLYAGSSAADGLVYELETGNNYRGTAINSYYKTYAIRGLQEHENYIKIWRTVYLLVETSGSWFMNFNYTVDFRDESGATEQVDLSSTNSTLWGQFVWGVGQWGSGQDRKVVRVNLRNAVGKVIQFKFSTNAVSNYWKLHDVKVDYLLRGER